MRTPREVTLMMTQSQKATAGEQSAAKLPSLLSLSVEDDERVVAAEAGPASSQTHTSGLLPSISVNLELHHSISFGCR